MKPRAGCMRALGMAVLIGALTFSCAAFAEDDGSAMITGRSVAISGSGCDRVTPVCAAMGDRLVTYDNECHARADGATSVSFSGCFDED